MHQCLANAPPLAVREHSQRPEPQRRLTVDTGPAAYHVSYYLRGLFGDNRELGDDVTVCSERLDQESFLRRGFTRLGKGGGVKREDAVLVPG